MHFGEMLCTASVFCVLIVIGYCQETRNLADVPCGQQLRGDSRSARRHQNDVFDFLHRGGRIIGGQNASPGEFPWVASIRRSGGHFCGGTIVHRRWIVSAGHCMCSGTVEIPAKQLEVAIGEYNMKEPQIPTIIRVKSVHLHPEYKCPRFVNDIALLELEREITWTSAVGPACLPYYGQTYSAPITYSASEATAAGWGWRSEEPDIGNRADVLQKVNVKVLDNDLCREWYTSQGKKVKILETQLCAGDEQGGRDSCWADSGGPLMVRSPDGLVVVGVVSTGIGCGRPKLPGIYTRMSSFMPWVLHMVRD